MGSVSSAPGASAAFMGTSEPPTLSTTALIGTGGNATIEGTNTSGKITLVVGGLGVGAGKVMSMTFAGTPPYRNGCAISFTAGNANFAAINGQLYAVATKNGVDLHVAGLALAAGVYIGYYQVIGY